jgi:thiamine transporter ThiT
MSNISTGRKLGIAARIAGEQMKRTRTYGAVRSGVRATVGHFAAVLRQLWHEITGFIFLAFAAFGGLALVKEYLAYHARGAGSDRVAIAAGFMLVFGWFGVTSFRRARKPRK